VKTLRAGPQPYQHYEAKAINSPIYFQQYGQRDRISILPEAPVVEVLKRELCCSDLSRSHDAL